jgi:predicted small lipoprotein YifL
MNIRLKSLFALATIAIMLSACGPARSWRDVSGRHRSYDAALADHETCSDEEMPSENQNATGAELAAAVSRVDVCMAHRGWSKIRD